MLKYEGCDGSDGKGANAGLKGLSFKPPKEQVRDLSGCFWWAALEFMRASSKYLPYYWKNKRYYIKIKAKPFPFEYGVDKRRGNGQSPNKNTRQENT